jgi:hypothetical protein
MKKEISRDEAKAQGLGRFYTGEPCFRSHLAERDTKTGRCVECTREYSAKSKRKLKARCPGRVRRQAREAAKLYYQRNREQVLLRLRERRQRQKAEAAAAAVGG